MILLRLVLVLKMTRPLVLMVIQTTYLLLQKPNLTQVGHLIYHSLILAWEWNLCNLIRLILVPPVWEWNLYNLRLILDPQQDGLLTSVRQHSIILAWEWKLCNLIRLILVPQQDGLLTSIRQCSLILVPPAWEWESHNLSRLILVL